jgi:predicted Zn-ribbon and HTH transcriptional regulator
MTGNESVSAVDLVRKDQEIDKLRQSEAALRREVLRLGHLLSMANAKCKSCEYQPHPVDDRA